MIYTLQNKDRIDLFIGIQDITSDLHKFVYKQFTEQISTDDADIFVKYIQCQKTEINLSNTYKRLIIISLIAIARYFKNKNFVQLARSDMIKYFDSLRKSEDADPEHKWIGTYNLGRQLFLKFFKWVYYPTKEAKKRQVPEVMRDIPQLKRKEQSIYKLDDLWSPEDNHVFLKYCSDKRMQCYHAISRDTSARPSEILKLLVKDINFKLAGDKTYKLY